VNLRFNKGVGFERLLLGTVMDISSLTIISQILVWELLTYVQGAFISGIAPKG